MFSSLQMTRQKESANYHLGSLFVSLWRRYMDEYSLLTKAHKHAGSVGGSGYSLLRPDAATVGGIKGKVDLAQNAAMDTLGKAMSCYG